MKCFIEVKSVEAGNFAGFVASEVDKGKGDPLSRIHKTEEFKTEKEATERARNWAALNYIDVFEVADFEALAIVSPVR